MKVWSKFLSFLILEEGCSLPLKRSDDLWGFNVKQKFSETVRQVEPFRCCSVATYDVEQMGSASHPVSTAVATGGCRSGSRSLWDGFVSFVMLLCIPVQCYQLLPSGQMFRVRYTPSTPKAKSLVREMPGTFRRDVQTILMRLSIILSVCLSHTGCCRREGNPPALYWDVPGSDVGPETGNVTDVLHGFPQTLQTNYTVVSEPLPPEVRCWLCCWHTDVKDISNFEWQTI
jgi:hypothetical protein